MRNTRIWLKVFALGWVMVCCLSSGCKSGSASQYVSPRVEGRVLDSQSRQPIKDVRVRRLSGDETYRSDVQPKGGEVIEKTPAVRTGADGTFVLDSVRDLALMQKIGWYSVNLSFQHPAYETLQKMYSLTDATNTLTGEPLVKAGDILLEPGRK